MVTSDTGISLIKRFEGLLLESYKCPAGVWTIGYGHTKGVKENQRITEDMAVFFLIRDLMHCEKMVTRYTSEVYISQNRFDALVSFSYNVGTRSLRRSTLLRKLIAGDIQEAGNQFLRWNKAGGRVLRGLSIRRDAERQLFLL